MGALGRLPAPGHPHKARHGLLQQTQCDGGSPGAGIASSVVADQVDRGPVGASSASSVVADQVDQGPVGASSASSVVADQVDRGPVGALSAPVDAVVVLCCSGGRIVPVGPVDASQVSLVAVVCSAQGPPAAAVVWAA